MILRLVFVFSFFFFIITGAFAEYGVLVVESENGSENFCSAIFHTNTNFGTNIDEAVSLPLVDLTWWNGWDASLVESMTVKDRIVLLNNISLTVTPMLMYQFGAAGILIKNQNANFRETDIPMMENFTITQISPESYDKIGGNIYGITVKQFIPPKNFYFDFAYILIGFIAFTSVLFGGVWTKAARTQVETGQIVPLKDLAGEEPEKLSTVPLTSRQILCLVLIYIGWGAFLLAFVLLHYYFFNYMVYVDIAIYCVTSTMSLYWCFLPFIRRFPLGRHSLKYFCCTSMEIRESIWCMICVAITVVWCVFIRKSWIWTIQNVMGMAICISTLSIFRSSSLKNCTAVIGLLFLYDIFMVFVTPLFTQDGKSVMERMVVGGSKITETPLMVPTVFQCPYLSSNPMAVCYRGYLVLGFGDIIVPGILTSYCYDFSMKNKSTKIYFISSMIGYCLGLILTAIFINVMKVAQPALLYLIPCCLLPVYVIAIIKKQFLNIWNNHPLGYKLVDKIPDEINSEESSFTY